MESISAYMIGQHKRCDEDFARAEQAAHAGDWKATEAGFGAFLQAMERHFAMEEKVLFPAFEERTGMTMGPTQVMRIEHQQMRGLFEQMRAAQQAHDGDQFLGAAETLLVLMQQHNMKEESILYTMMDQAFGGEARALLERAESATA